jgi:pyruvate,orthophosphate dikinase
MEAATDPLVVAFDGPLPAGLDPVTVLGGKAAGLRVMAGELGLPVPPGFVLTTGLCREYLARGWPLGIETSLQEHLGELERRTGRRFGDTERPLLVSVRSGAPVSMPGMMDTLLNVGMTSTIRERLTHESGSPEFAADTWLRFCRMFAEIVLDAPRQEVAAAAEHDGSASGILEAAERVRAVAAHFGGIPEDPEKQLSGAIETVFRSWRCERAQVFREREGIPSDLGTAATVQAMVFGNLDDRSGTGVAFTRDPATGDPGPCGDYLTRAQGEDVVAGTHRVRGIDGLREQLPDVYAELLNVLRRLELHYRDMCDVEFTVSGGKLYVLQTRVGKRSPLAAVRIAVAMADDPAFPLTQTEAVARVGDETLRELANLGRVASTATAVGHGLAVSPGVGAGAVCCDADRAAELAATGTPVVLVRPETSPSDVHGMVASAALVTTTGGMVSHAAVVARGWAIPAVCSLEDARVEGGGLFVSGQFIAEGETVTVDGGTGSLYRGDCREDEAADLPELRRLREWASAATGGDARPSATREVTQFEVLRALQLKGLCAPERLAGALQSESSLVADWLSRSGELVKETPRGYMVTPAGRAWVLEQLLYERMAADQRGLEACFERFLPFNHSFKKLVTGYQQEGINGPAHESWPRLFGDLSSLHGDFRPLVDETAAAVERLGAYGPRFDSALEAVESGDASMVASPLKDSYHTVWFEYHEELIALTGRDRATEEAAES